ncbi:BTB/POZ domain-containing protein 3-like [Paramacrobiotus metropolitanus]|uniref:BTB/POZ domain-containing protein 3-like n=1 Tax=Paramacrobiotus metropolitanus TaxID=2943436 RepID=UPI002445CE20|nr:BTB/POZ domain-containing protein 3-like [Paramacrobiotus metropolitanus]
MSTSATLSEAPAGRNHATAMLTGRNRLAGLVEQAFASGDLSDVRFTVGRPSGDVRDFTAHKFVLGIRSPVFRMMFYGNVPENGQDAVDIPDIHPDAFANMLSFVYTDGVPVDDLNAGNVFATMSCANKYGLPELVQLCSNFVVSQLTADNCLATLKQAVFWHADNIVDECLALVDHHSVAMLQSDQFDGITQETLQRILQRKTLLAEEHMIYLAVERWAAAACSSNAVEASAANRRQMLGDALFHVRFPLLNNTELADGPGKSGLLTESELLSLFMYQNATVKPTLAFPTERRLTKEQQKEQSPQTLFRTGEEVFVQSLGKMGPWWQPARVIACYPHHVLFTWCKNGESDTATADQVIRAKDYLKRDQTVYVRSMRAYARYEHAGMDGQPRVNGDRIVELADLLLRKEHVALWKAGRK